MQKEIVIETQRGDEIKVEWERNGWKLSRTSHFPRQDTIVKREFNFFSKKITRISLDTRTNLPHEQSGYTDKEMTFKKMKKSAPKMIEKAMVQYKKFKKNKKLYLMDKK